MQSETEAARRLKELEALRADLELFTNSGSWVYDNKSRMISFSAGAYHILGLLHSEKPMALSLLESLCDENTRRKLQDFLFSSCRTDAASFAQLTLHDSYGNDIDITLCARTSVDFQEDICHGLIKLTS